MYSFCLFNCALSVCVKRGGYTTLRLRTWEKPRGSSNVVGVTVSVQVVENRGAVCDFLIVTG
jgi:hypothetical protein